MADTQALVDLSDPQLYLAGDISICMGEYTDADSRRAAVARLLAFAFLHLGSEPAREDLRIAAQTAGISIEIQ